MIYTEGVALATLCDSLCDPVTRPQETCAQSAPTFHIVAQFVALLFDLVVSLPDRSVVLAISNNNPTPLNRG